MAVALRFMVDENAGKMAKWLRIMGYDAQLFVGRDDGTMVREAFTEGRIILTRDSQILKRRIVTTGKLKAVLLASENPKQQFRQVVQELGLDGFKPFTVCLECNNPLSAVARDQVKGLVPAYVFETQEHYMTCPGCRRIYWRGTHWQAMVKDLKNLLKEVQP